MSACAASKRSIPHRPSAASSRCAGLAVPNDERPTLVLANRSDLELEKQITAPGATWLDHRLVEREPMPLSMGGFGREVREAMDARAEHLADEGLARRENQRIVLQTQPARHAPAART